MNERDDQDAMPQRQWLSALADGELQAQDIDQALRALEGDAQGREAWHAYHVVGDVLRGGDAAGSARTLAFAQRVRARLESQPAADVTPPVAAGLETQSARRAGAAGVLIQAANDSAWRWKLLAAVASVVAIAAVAWTALGGLAPGDTAGALASRATSGTDLAQGGTERARMLRDPRLDEFLAAHRQMAGSTALSAPAAFLQDAAYERSGR